MTPIAISADSLFLDAIEALDRIDWKTDQVTACCEVAFAASVAGDRDVVQRLTEKVLEIDREYDYPRDAAGALGALGYRCRSAGDVPASARHFKDAVASLDAIGHPVNRARAAAIVASWLHRAGHVEIARSLLLKEVDCPAPADDGTVVSDPAGKLAAVLADLGFVEDAEAVLERAPDPDYVRNHLVLAYLARGKDRPALEVIDRLSASAKDEGLFLFVESWVARGGDAERARELVKRVQLPNMRLVTDSIASAAAGMPDRLAAIAAQAMAIDEPFQAAFVGSEVAARLAEVGLDETALEVLERAASRLEPDRRFPHDHTLPLELVAESFARVGRYDDAIACLPKRRDGWRFARGTIAVLAWRDGDTELAERIARESPEPKHAALISAALAVARRRPDVLRAFPATPRRFLSAWMNRFLELPLID